MAAQSPFLLLRSRKSGPRVETKLLPPLSRGLGAVPPAGGLSPGAPGSCCSRPCLRATGGCRAAAPPEGPPATGARLGGTKGAEHSPQQRRRAALAAGARGPPPGSRGSAPSRGSKRLCGRGTRGLPERGQRWGGASAAGKGKLGGGPLPRGRAGGARRGPVGSRTPAVAQQLTRAHSVLCA